MAFTPYPKIYRCYYKESKKLHQINVGDCNGISDAIDAVKESLMKNSLPYKEAVLVSIK